MPSNPRNKWHGPKIDYAFVHTVIDDDSRIATATTCVLHRSVQWLADRDVTVERVLPDNGSAYRSHLERDTCDALAIKPKRSRP